MKKTKKTKPMNVKSEKTYKSVFSNSAQNIKVSTYNSFIALVFGLVMFIVCICAMEIAYAISGIAIGQATAGNFETVADIVIMVITIIMVCSFDLFFTFKINNLIIKAMTKRFWHVDKNTGAIIKGDAKDASMEDVDNIKNTENNK